MSNLESLKTNLIGRLKKIKLNTSDCLLPIFECVVNSIQSIEERTELDKNFSITDGKITVEFVYDSTQLINNNEQDHPITGFKIFDNGCGFNSKNYESFTTFDSEYKESKGCKGIGRLQWLKEFDHADVYSKFIEGGKVNIKNFNFSAKGIVGLDKNAFTFSEDNFCTVVYLSKVIEQYNEKLQISAKNFATKLLNHILWYFLRPEKCPIIEIKTKNGKLSLEGIFNEIELHDIKEEVFNIKDTIFTIYHIKIRNGTSNKAVLTQAANGRAVKEKNIRNELGLSQPLVDESGNFSYMAFVFSDYFDQIVNTERTELNFSKNNNETDLFINVITEKDFLNGVFPYIKSFLKDLIEQENALKLKKICNFINEKPNYKFLLDKNRVSKDQLLDFSLKNNENNNEIETHLFKLKMNIINDNISKGNSLKLRNLETKEDFEEYKKDLNSYLQNLKAINQSSLAEYVVHRKVIIDLLSKAIGIQNNQKFVNESVIHKLVFPMRENFENAWPDENNLWLIDERLSFNSYLASDISFKSMPITDSNSDKRPDILSCYDKPFLLSEDKHNPFHSFTIIEFKRPMRGNISAKADNNPIEQVLNYIKELQNNKLRTYNGREINARNCPIYCYIIADITSGVAEACIDRDFIQTSDGNGYFGFIKSKNAFITVMSYDGLLQSATERNQSFFDKLNI